MCGCLSRKIGVVDGLDAASKENRTAAMIQTDSWSIKKTMNWLGH